MAFFRDDCGCALVSFSAREPAPGCGARPAAGSFSNRACRRIELLRCAVLSLHSGAQVHVRGSHDVRRATCVLHNSSDQDMISNRRGVVVARVWARVFFNRIQSKLAHRVPASELLAVSRSLLACTVRVSSFVGVG